MKKLRPLFGSCVVLFFALVSIHSYGEVTLPRILSSHMVLQRGRPIHLWGWADPGEQVKATLRNTQASTTANGLGQWSLYSAGGAGGRAI